MRQIVFRKRAQLEFDEAGDWYEKERPGLGLEFLVEIHLLIQRIASTPEQFPILYRDVRKAVARRFPYCIYFRERDKRSLCWRYFTAQEIRQYGSSESNAKLPPLVILLTY